MKNCQLRFFKAGGIDTTVKVVDIKLEQGEVADPLWTAAPEDMVVQLEITKIY